MTPEMLQVFIPIVAILVVFGFPVALIFTLKWFKLKDKELQLFVFQLEPLEREDQGHRKPEHHQDGDDRDEHLEHFGSHGTVAYNTAGVTISSPAAYPLPQGKPNHPQGERHER